ncbi:MAG TPA: hypothetical protein VJR90_01055 [Gammaproteobacteria bacterium]|nr:hypothetical protein [Gammaproteobacteria bacterium]
MHGDTILKLLGQEVAARVATVARGSPRTFEEYQHLVGVITGLNLAERIVKDLLETESDDDSFAP